MKDSHSISFIKQSMLTLALAICPDIPLLQSALFVMFITESLTSRLPPLIHDLEYSPQHLRSLKRILTSRSSCLLREYRLRTIKQVKNKRRHVLGRKWTFRGHERRRNPRGLLGNTFYHRYAWVPEMDVR